jgi:hypothetical protein
VAGNSQTEPQESAPTVSQRSQYRDRDSYSRERDDDDALTFSSRDQRVIRDYFASDGDNLPPGLAKRHGNLPPGLERHLQRDGSLPPGLQKRVQPFPEDLDRRLEPLPDGYSRVILSDRALILASDGRIVDLMFIYR